MLEHMGSIVEEVKKIESKVVEISRLQEIFTEKVLQQVQEMRFICMINVVSSSLGRYNRHYL